MRNIHIKSQLTFPNSKRVSSHLLCYNKRQPWLNFTVENSESRLSSAHSQQRMAIVSPSLLVDSKLMRPSTTTAAENRIHASQSRHIQEKRKLVSTPSYQTLIKQREDKMRQIFQEKELTRLYENVVKNQLKEDGMVADDKDI